MLQPYSLNTKQKSLIITQRHSEKYLNDSIRSELAPQAFDAGYHASSTEGCQPPVWDSSRWTHSGTGVSSPVSRHTHTQKLEKLNLVAEGPSLQRGSKAEVPKPLILERQFHS